MTNTIYTAEVVALATKFRKGATSSFKLKEYKAVLEPIGFKVEVTKKEGRTVLAVTFTAPNGETLVEVKEPSYRAVTFYDACRFVKKHGAEDAVSAALGLPSYEEEQADKQVYGVQYDLTNAGICPACFRVQKLDDNGGLVLHGYQRPGDGYIHGSCYGVGHKPLEVSVEGTDAYLNKVLVPCAKSAAEALAEFKVSPPTSFRINRNRDRYGREPEFVVVDATTCAAWDTEGKYPGNEFRKELENLGRRLERDSQQAAKAVAAYGDVVTNWVPDIAPIERKAAKRPAAMIKWILRCF